MDWNDFYKSVKDGRYEGVYLFTGPEELNKKEALAALRRAILPAGLEQLNDATLENSSAQAIIDSAETMPVMCERRIVVVRDWAPLLNKGKADDHDTERMNAWLQDVPDSCIVVFYMTQEPDGRKALVKKLKALNGYVEFGYLSGATLLKWCNQQLKPYGKKIQPNALDEMSLMAGQDLNRLSGELKKLAAYTQDAPEITPADVHAVVAPSAEYSVFMILDHLLEGKSAQAADVVRNVLQTEPSVVRLIALLTSQLRIDTHFKLGLEAKKSSPEILKLVNEIIKPGKPISPYRAKHIERQIRPIPAAALQQRYQWCIDADYDIKSGRMKDRAALDALMLKIAQPWRGTK